MSATVSDQKPGSATRPRNPRGEGSRLRAEILDAADTLLARSHNAERLSLRAVAKEAGIAPTSIYLHFPDVDHLKLAVAERGFVELDELREAASNQLSDPRQVALARSRAYAHFALAHPGRYRLMFGPELPPSLSFNAVGSRSRQSFETVVHTVEICRNAGITPCEASAFHLATQVWVAVHGLVTLRIDRPGFPWEPLDTMVDSMVGTLLGFDITVPQ
jgi:AcrR family transcriptional regulator